MDSPIILLIGPVGAGKTTTLERLVNKWRDSSRNVRGILAHRAEDEGHLIGYDLEVIGENKTIALARKSGTGIEKVGPFTFSEAALTLGRRALSDSVDAEIVIIDEVGPLELMGGGWAKEIVGLLQESNAVMILVVRRELHYRIQQWLRPYHRPIRSFLIEEFNENALETLFS